ncbi:MAG TPA: GH116 family glycosyl-hydrolase, partial [Puia sp.]
MRRWLALACLAAWHLVLRGPVSAQGSIDTSHHVPLEKHLTVQWKKELWSQERKVYRGRELLTIGMPCGGIAAGQLYVRGDGTLAGWWIANNAYNTGYGADRVRNFPTALGPWKTCYQTFRPPSYIKQGFAVTMEQGGRRRTMRLDEKGFDGISFTGEYPIATINYASASAPLTVEEEVFSPFIPLDAKESATPGVIMRFRLRNVSAAPVKASFTGWLQNLVCLDIAGEIHAESRNRIIRKDGMTSVFMDLTGAADSLRRHPYYGNVALSILDANGYGNADFNDSVDGPRQDEFTKRTGDTLVGAAGTPVGEPIVLAPGESRDVVFLLTWYFPNRPAYYRGSNTADPVAPENWTKALPVRGVPILGNMYANWYGSALDVALWLKNELPRLSRETHLFHDTWYLRGSLPYWLKQRLLMPVSTLATETCQWWADGKFWAWEGVGSCVGTCTH